MPTTGQDPSPKPRGVELKEEHIDPAWRQRWRAAKAHYPDDLLRYAGMVRGLFSSPDAPLSAPDGKVFIVYRTNPRDVGDVHVEGVYSNIPAANEHVLLCFAREYADAMAEDCVWTMNGERPARQPPAGSVAQMLWSYSSHACLALEVTSLPGDDSPGPRKVFIVEEWVESEPPEDLVVSMLGKQP